MKKTNNNINKIKHVAFDFDRTIWTTKDLSIVTLKAIYRKLFNKRAPIIKFNKLMGLAVKDKLYHLDNINWTLLYEEWKDFYWKNYCNYLETYEGLVETVKMLHGKNINLYILSNKIVELINVWLKELNILQYFKKIYWLDNLPQTKPSEQVIPYVLNQINCKKEEFMLIWDSLIDYKTYENTWVKFGLANWCGKDSKNVINLKPDYVFNKPTDILNIF